MVDLPRTNLRQRRRRRRIVFAALGVALLAAAGGGLVWLSQAAFLRVTNIQVSGTQTVPTSTVEAYARQEIEGSYLGLFARSNIFLYPRTDIAAGLLAHYPALRAADVHASDFHTVSVTLAERQPAALWCPAGQTKSGCEYMDEGGLVYGLAPEFSDAPYLVYQGALASTSQPDLRQYLTADGFQSLSALVAALSAKEPDDPVGLVVVDQNLDARVYFKDDFLLIFSLRDGGGDIFERFGLALQSSAFAGKTLGDFQYLDLRFGDKLYYKLKGE